MFVLHKMATSPSSSLCSFSLFLSKPSSLPLLKPPLLSLHSPPLKRFISTASELQHDTQARRRTLLGSPYTKTSPLLSLSTQLLPPSLPPFPITTQQRMRKLKNSCFPPMIHPRNFSEFATR